MPASLDAASLRATLARAGFIAAAEEAAELLARAGDDTALLDAMLQRRLTGEPLAWIVGRVRFAGVEVAVDPGVYVPRWHSEDLALRAAARLPECGVAVDLCTGSGALAVVMASRRPQARVVAGDIDERAVACARRNGVEAYTGDLFDPLPAELRGRVDVVTAVVPYVPTAELPLLQRDTFAFESELAYHGGGDGTDVLRRVLREAPAWLRAGGAVLLEMGGDQPALLAGELAALGYAPPYMLADEEGDVRGIEAVHARRLASEP